SGRQKAGIQSWRTLEIGYDLLAFIDDSVDGVAGFAAGRCLDELEHLLKTLDMAFRLFLVLFKGGLEVFGLRRLRHLRQSGEYFLLRVVDVLQRLMEQIIEHFWLCRHRTSSSLFQSNSSGAPLFRAHELWLPSKKTGPRAVQP